LSIPFRKNEAKKSSKRTFSISSSSEEEELKV
jgi:hypothetical protein